MGGSCRDQKQTLQLSHSSGGEFDTQVPVTPSEAGWRPNLKLHESLSETHLVISQPTSLPQAADAKRDKAEAGELGHRFFSTQARPAPHEMTLWLRFTPTKA